MRLPAFGRELLAARRMGARPEKPVVLTDSWDVARHYQAADLFALVCEPIFAPYDFTLLYGLDVMLHLVADDVLGICERVARAQPSRLAVLLRGDLWEVLTSTRASMDVHDFSAERKRFADQALRALAEYEARELPEYALAG